jgi:hypothetical protein
MKKILATIALIMALGLTAFAGHNNNTPPDDPMMGTSQDVPPPDCVTLRGHND